MYQMPRRTKLSGGISLEWVIKKEEAKISARERCEAQDVLSLLACLVWKRYNMAGGRKDWAGGGSNDQVASRPNDNPFYALALEKWWC